MTTTSPPRLLRDPGSSNRSTLLELLLDVFYVATFARLSMLLAGDLTWPGVGKGAILLLAAWWAWSVTSLTTDFYDPRQRVVQSVIGSTMFGVALMTAAIPTAFDAQGLLFASAYVGIHLVREIMLVGALRGHVAQARAKRFLFWFAVSGVPWLVGGFVDPAWRVMLWAAALVIDYVSAGLRYPTPKLGRVPLDQYDRLSAHFGERYQQIAILVIGDLVLASTLKIGGPGFTTSRVVVFLATVTTALLLWQIYAFRTGVFVERAVHGYPRRAVRLASYIYVALVAGVIAMTAGAELALRQPFGTTQASWVALIVGGSALFVLGRVIFEYELLGRLSRSRVGWLVLLIGVAPALKPLAPIFVLITTAGILLGVTLTDAWRERHDASDAA